MQNRVTTSITAVLVVVLWALFSCSSYADNAITQWLDAKKSEVTDWWTDWTKEKRAQGVELFEQELNELTTTTIEHMRQEIADEIQVARDDVTRQLGHYHQKMEALEAEREQLETTLRQVQDEQRLINAQNAVLNQQIAVQQQRLDTIITTAERILFIVAITMAIRIYGPAIGRVVLAAILRGKTIKPRRVLG